MSTDIHPRLVAAVREQLSRRRRARARRHHPPVILTGSVTQVPVRPGDRVAAEIDGLGRVALQLRH